MTEDLLDPKGQSRFDALLLWSAQATVSGHPVPGRLELEAVARTARVASAGAEGSLLARWEPTISWLLKQAAFGVSSPHLHLPDELMAPTGADAEADADVEADAGNGMAPTPTVSKAPSHGVSRLPKWEVAALAQV